MSTRNKTLKLLSGSLELACFVLEKDPAQLDGQLIGRLLASEEEVAVVM